MATKKAATTKRSGKAQDAQRRREAAAALTELKNGLRRDIATDPVQRANALRHAALDALGSLRRVEALLTDDWSTVSAYDAAPLVVNVGDGKRATITGAEAREVRRAASELGMTPAALIISALRSYLSNSKITLRA